MRELGPAVTIHTAYQERLARVLESPDRAMPLKSEPGLALVEASCDGITLTALVDPASHTVRKAAYAGATSDVHRGLLEVLCEIMIDRPIQECSDHATIYLEHRLRDPSQPRPVSGIITPDNADPAFRLPGVLVRALATEYRRTVGQLDAENFFDPSPSPVWRELSAQEKRQRVQAALTEICGVLGLSDAEASLVSVGQDDRVFLELNRAAPSAAKGRLLMRIEAHLKTAVEPTLYVYTAERKDLNKIRRLAAPDVETPMPPSGGEGQ